MKSYYNCTTPEDFKLMNSRFRHTNPADILQEHEITFGEGNFKNVVSLDAFAAKKGFYRE